MAGLYPLSRMQQTDSNGNLLSGARLFLFDGGTTTPRIGYRDLALTTPHPNPILADAAGRIPLVYLADGYYRQRLTSDTGTLIFDDDGIPVLTTSSGGAGTTVDPDSVLKTGDFKIAYNDQPQSGFVRANGRTIGSAASGATERANADTQALYEHLWGYTNITVSGGKGASAAADYAANKPLVLPNSAGRMLAGMDNMGAGIQSVLTLATSGNTQNPGTIGGAETVTIQNAYLPVTSPWTATATTGGTIGADGSHTHSYSGITGDEGAFHHHDYDVPSAKTSSTQAGGGAGLSNIWTGSGTGGTTNESAVHQHSYSGNTAAGGTHTHSFTGSTSVTMGANGGGGQAFNKLSPYMTLMLLMRL